MSINSHPYSILVNNDYISERCWLDTEFEVIRVAGGYVGYYDDQFKDIPTFGPRYPLLGKRVDYVGYEERYYANTVYFKKLKGMQLYETCGGILLINNYDEPVAFYAVEDRVESYSSIELPCPPEGFLAHPNQKFRRRAV